MIWSIYNYLFNSEKYGFLLYNSTSNSFLQLDNDSYNEIIKIKEDIKNYSFAEKPLLYFQLRNYNIIVDDDFDENYKNRLKMTRLSYNYNNSIMMLTIAPTLACNFKCSYCFENDLNPIIMNDQTEEKIIEFIKRHSSVKHIILSWFGGEPLLCFDRICSITKKIKELKIQFQSDLITNGYMLDEDKISKFEELNIKNIQITIDGPEEIHDKRRKHKDGSGTFNKILSNLDLLFDNWQKRVDIRINIDNSNISYYHKIHEYLLNRFKKIDRKRIRIYPGIVHDNENLHPDISCFRDRTEEAIFNIEQYKNYGIDDFSFFPSYFFAGCIASRNNGYVIGPEGEIYKCWDDLGIKEKIAGSIYPDKQWNMDLIANYQVGASYLDDPECKSCFYFPVCDGGCVYVRMQNNLKKCSKNVCTKFKNNLEKILEIYYEIKNK